MKKLSVGLMLVSLLLVSAIPVFAGGAQKKADSQNPQAAKPNYTLVIAINIIREAMAANGGNGVTVHMIEIEGFTSPEKCEQAGRKARENLGASGATVTSVCFEK